MDSGSKKRSTTWPVATASVGIALLIGGILALAWVGGEPSAPGRSPQPDAVSGLCAAAVAADANNRAEARRVFLDEVHDRLHRLADRAAQQDRPAATRLLRAKERVEANLEDPKAGLVEELVDLADATRSAMRAVGVRVPPRCESAGVAR